MSEQSNSVDMQAILHSMLERLKINRSSEVVRSQHTETRWRPKPDSKTWGESPTAHADVTEHNGHTQQWDNQRQSKEDYSMEFEVLSLDSLNAVQPSAATVEDQNSIAVVPRWTRRPVLLRPAAFDATDTIRENKMTLSAVPMSGLSDRQYLCNDPGSHQQEHKTDSKPSTENIGGNHTQSRMGYAVMQDSPKTQGQNWMAPLRIRGMGGAGTPESAERTGIVGEQQLPMGSAFQNSSSFSAVGTVDAHTANDAKFAPVEPDDSTASLSGLHTRHGATGHSPALKNFSRSSRLVDSSSQKHLAYSADKWNENKQGRTAQSATGGKVMSMTDPAKSKSTLRDTAITQKPSGAGKKKRRWVNGKTMRWAQKIRENWKERQAAVMRQVPAESGDKQEKWENNLSEAEKSDIFNEVNDPVQPSRRTDFFSDVLTEEEEQPCQTELDHHVNKDALPPSKRSSADRLGWSGFLSNETPLPIHTSSPSETGMETWRQQHRDHEGLAMAESWVNQSELRVRNSRQEEKNNIEASALQDLPLLAPLANENAAELPLVHSEAEPHTVEYRGEEEEPTQSAPSFDFSTQTIDLESSALSSRVHLNRKREHCLQQRTIRKRSMSEEGGLSESNVHGSWRNRDSSGSLRRSYVGHEEPEEPHNDAEADTAPLQCSESEDSDASSSPETVVKKRKTRDLTEDTRRVRFAEVLVTPIPCVPYDFELQDETRSLLPSWILALKNRRKKRKL